MCTFMEGNGAQSPGRGKKTKVFFKKLVIFFKKLLVFLKNVLVFWEVHHFTLVRVSLYIRMRRSVRTSA